MYLSRYVSSSCVYFQLHSAVQFFWKRGKKVLVLGRKHMYDWPQKEMKAIKRKADMFFAENQWVNKKL